MSTSRNHTLSQHFLKSPRLALKLIGHSNLKKRDLVLDIGAGSGVITTALATRVREVWAIEKDHETAEKLRKNLKKYGIKNVKVIEADFLSISLPAEPYKVFANPPFNLSAKILYKLLNLENRNGEIISLDKTSFPKKPTSINLDSASLTSHKALKPPHTNSPVTSLANPENLKTPTTSKTIHNSPDSIYLILQKQLALKLIPTDRHYTSQLGKIISERYAAKIKYPLKPTDFTPPPAVPTVLWEAKPFPI